MRIHSGLKIEADDLLSRKAFFVTIQDSFLPSLPHKIRSLTFEDSGMSTIEYAIGTIAAAALAAVLYLVVTGDSVSELLNSIIGKALSVKF